jgi:quinol monooxygenase YgiN
MDTGQITIVVFIKAKQTTKATVKDELIGLTENTHKESGNLNYNLHISDTDDSLFIIYENWKDQAALDNHMAQPYLKDFLSKQDDLLEKPIDGKICKTIK